MTKGLTTRKPRTRSVAKLYGIEAAKARFLERLADIGSVTETRQKLGIRWNRILYWLESDPVFRDKYDEIGDRQREAHKRQVGTLVPKALEVYDQALDKKTDMKHRLHAADKVLSSEGIIQEPVEKHDVLGAIKVEVEYVNRNRNPNTGNTPPTPLPPG